MYVHNGFWETEEKLGPCPVNATITKGSVHITASRGYVDYVLHDERALKFREWVKDTGVPDETFFSSLNFSPQLGVPGAYLGKLYYRGYSIYDYTNKTKHTRIYILCMSI